jgi:hypothetical protein
LVATVVPSTDVGTDALLAPRANLVDLVDEHDAVLLDGGDRLLQHLFLIEELVALFRQQHGVAFFHRHAAGLGAAGEGLAENLAEIEHAHRRAGHAGDIEGRQVHAAGILHLDLDLLIVELALAQHLAELLSGVGAGILSHQRIEHALLGMEIGLGGHFLAQPFFGHGDRPFEEVAHDLLDVAADITDLGEFGRLDLDERRLRQFGQSARNLGLADAGRPDHQDVLGQNLLTELFGQLLTAPAVPESDGDGALGVVLADDVSVELRDDLARAESGHRLSMVTLSLV